MRRLIAALIFVWAMPMLAAAETVVITADRMIDVAEGSVVQAPVVVITDGRIASVSARGVMPAGISADARRVDLPGHTILPGRIDLHVHLANDAHYQGDRRLQFTDEFWAVQSVTVRRLSGGRRPVAWPTRSTCPCSTRTAPAIHASTSPRAR